MQLLLLRHFHCNTSNEVSSIGLQQLDVVVHKLKSHHITSVLATDHLRVTNSARLLCDLLSLKLVLLETKFIDCINNLQKGEDVLVLSQQPILAEIASFKSKKTYALSCFPTGKLVEVKVP